MNDRLSRLRPDALSVEQRAIYDRIVNGPRASTKRVIELTDEQGGLHGPFNAWMLAPPIGSALEALGAAIRFSSCFDGRLRELAILTVARHFDSAFERYAHEAIGRDLGITDAELAAVRRGDVPTTASEQERLALMFTHELLTSGGDIADDDYRRATQQLGQRGVFELSTLVGFYGMVAMQLRLYRVEPPA